MLNNREGVTLDCSLDSQENEDGLALIDEEEKRQRAQVRAMLKDNNNLVKNNAFPAAGRRSPADPILKQAFATQSSNMMMAQSKPHLNSSNMIKTKLQHPAVALKPAGLRPQTSD